MSPDKLAAPPGALGGGEAFELETLPRHQICRRFTNLLTTAFCVLVFPSFRDCLDSSSITFVLRVKMAGTGAEQTIYRDPALLYDQCHYLLSIG